MINTKLLRVQQRNRMPAGGRINRAQPRYFTFAGRRLMGYEGDTLASALLANGVDIVGRSFKYGRARGLMTAGVEEPNGILQLGATEATQVPNVRATEQSLYDGLVCSPVNGWPSAENDVMGLIGRIGGSLMSPGFYYKTFMWPRFGWKSYEHFIRLAAGLGRSPSVPDPDRYDHLHHHTDILVVGSGPAGLMAALSAARSGKRVMLADEQSEAGGSLLFSDDCIDGKTAVLWVADVVSQLQKMPNVTHLQRSTVTGYHDHNFLTIRERRSDHLGEHAPAGTTRHRMHKVRAASVILATGAHERPLVYANNDLPGCFVASAISHYVRRYAVIPGNTLVVMTSNDGGYQCAFDWQDAGREVSAIVDTRQKPDGSVTENAIERGLKVIAGSAVIEAVGRKRVAGARVAPLSADGSALVGPVEFIECDTLASSGGWSPAVHLSCHTGSRPVWDETVLGFVPGPTLETRFEAGSVAGHHSLSTCLADGVNSAAEALVALSAGDSESAKPDAALAVGKAPGKKPGKKSLQKDGRVPGKKAGQKVGRNGVQKAGNIPEVNAGKARPCPAMPIYLIPHQKPCSRAPKQFVDMQNDVTADGIQMTVREGFESIEHVKRYTALGFGTDQGKTGNINGMAIVAQALGKSIPETGTTVFRPNYTPVSFGSVAGSHVNELFDPQRFTPMHRWHVERGALFEDVGQWKRAWYYPNANETMADALLREQLAVRNHVGILDASTLGKIDIQGPDAREFLGRVYTNAWAKLAPGRCRYGLMCGEDGMVMDDGVTACLADEHFLMSTTTGGAANVLSWLEMWHQTEWPELEVYFNSVTDHWATLSIAGPNSRALLAELTDMDLSPEAFAFMDWRAGTVAGVPARIFRISFTGELSYEINVPACYGMHVWKQLFDKGRAHGLTPYGTETMHVLRAEKGFIIVGQETDGSMTPYDLDHGWAVAENKPFSFLGKRGMKRADCQRSERKELVGLMTQDSQTVLPEGAQAVRNPQQAIPMTMVGHVTSSYYSATLERSIALAVIKGGLKRKGESVHFPLADGRVVEAMICAPVFLDSENARQKA